MKDKVLSILVTGLSILVVIDISVDQLTGYSFLNNLTKLVGISGGIRGVPFWIKLFIAVLAMVLIVKYDRIFDFSFRDKKDRKYK